ncbi:MAG: HIT domain-containing protein [Deltaproteobacteria bacterium]|nr:HIT domain-containing protein [Deltaproteobacteria bacterium]
MKQIWAPWRMDYILGNKSQKCIFCHPARTKHNKKKLLLSQGEFSLVMLNRYPYTNCHLLIAPRKHTNALDRLSAEESLNLFTTLSKSVNALNKSIKPEGFNIGMNLGRIAGAGVKDHLHFHIVPRWNGDTNFMPILAESMVVPEHLEKAYDKLLPFFEKF